MVNDDLEVTRSNILSGLNMGHIMIMLDNPAGDVRQSVLKTVVTLANHSTIPPGTIRKIDMMLGDPREPLQHTAQRGLVALLRHDHVRAVLSMPEAITECLIMLGSRPVYSRRLTTATLAALVQYGEIFRP
ncbi:hypothetical protein B0H19DRAFT_1077170 [Mycena capillaripes]|nr:hypothetical protein B0H19DRAFT_1077170 [Mycena capillaripes]